MAYSPINIAAILALLLLGSGGSTYREIFSVIDLENRIVTNSFHKYFGGMLERLGVTSETYRVNFANALFVQEGYPIRETYKTNSESFYHNQIVNVDFARNPSHAQRVINNWASEKTNGKIKEILNESPSVDTRMILASAMYFKAEWETPFVDDMTRLRPFYTNGRKSSRSVMVEMMLVTGSFPYFKDDTLKCEIFGLPYKGNQTTMYVVVPKKSNKEKLKKLESRLNHTQVEHLVNNVRYREAFIGFPKMRIDTTIDLKRSLEELGVRTLFNPSEANLAQMSPGTGGSQRDNFNVNKNNNATRNFENPGLYADKIIHRVYMDITESGSEAAAVSAVTIEKSGDKVTVEVNVPFFFFIMHEETKALLFWGSVYTPTPNF